MKNFWLKFTNVGVNFILAIMLVGLTCIVMIQPSISVSSGNLNSVYYNGNIESKKITLMFNVYWGNEYIDGILNEFKERNLQTTFFIGGIWAEKFPEELQKIVNDGHEIGNHGYSHKEHSKLNYEGNQEEILRTHKIVKSQIGLDMTLFAPPSGDFNDVTVQTAGNLGYKTIMWTRDTIDWRDQDSEVIYSRAIKNAKGGDLVLMHPTKATLSALPKILDCFAENDLEVCTVTENIGV